jgi:hypothetical protein
MLATIDGKVFVTLWWVPLTDYRLPGDFFVKLNDRFERDLGFRAFWSTHESWSPGDPDDLNYLFNGGRRWRDPPARCRGRRCLAARREPVPGWCARPHVRRLNRTPPEDLDADQRRAPAVYRSIRPGGDRGTDSSDYIAGNPAVGPSAFVGAAPQAPGSADSRPAGDVRLGPVHGPLCRQHEMSVPAPAAGNPPPFAIREVLVPCLARR